MIATPPHDSDPDIHSPKTTTPQRPKPWRIETPEVEWLSPTAQEYGTVNWRLRVSLLFKNLLELFQEYPVTESVEEFWTSSSALEQQELQLRFGQLSQACAGLLEHDARSTPQESLTTGEINGKDESRMHQPSPEPTTEQSVKPEPSECSEWDDFGRPKVADEQVETLSASKPAAKAFAPKRVRHSHRENAKKCSSSDSDVGYDDESQSSQSVKRNSSGSTLCTRGQVSAGSPEEPEEEATVDHAVQVKRAGDLSALLGPTDAAFAAKYFKLVERLGQKEQLPESFTSLWHWLQGKGQGDGTAITSEEIVTLPNITQANRQRTGVQYSVTAVGLARHFDNQVANEVQARPGTSSRIAARIVTERLQPLQPGLSADQQRARRKSFATHLTRGRKWSFLAEELGFGILLGEVWVLGKSGPESLTKFVADVKAHPGRMEVLSLLGDQMACLVNDGHTNPTELGTALRQRGLWFGDPGSFAKPGSTHSVQDDKIARSLPIPGVTDSAPSEYEICELKKQMTEESKESSLSVKDTTFRFNAECLEGLSGASWYSDGLILLGMHLAERFPSARVGFSVAVHQEKGGKQVMADPFQRAAQKMEQWEEESPEGVVGFFPLWQHNNHFSLLEINGRERRLFHYDSLTPCTEQAVKDACLQRFPGFTFTDQQPARQNDSSSCGPVVLAVARERMVANQADLGEVGPEEGARLRQEAFALIQQAWREGSIVPPRAEKRKARGQLEGPANKRKSGK